MKRIFSLFLAAACALLAGCAAPAGTASTAGKARPAGSTQVISIVDDLGRTVHV